MDDVTAKVLAETWAIRDGGNRLDVGRTADEGGCIETYSWPSAYLRIAACAPEALRLLLEAEEAGERDGDCVAAQCPFCAAFAVRGDLPPGHAPIVHAPDCRWLLLMQKAGLR